MAGIGHIAVGVAAGRLYTQHTEIKTLQASRPLLSHPALWMVLLTTLSMLPDADVIAFSLGIPYHAPWGHRGATHSIVFAAICASFCTLAAHPLPLAKWRIWLFSFATMASHGLLDTLTTGGLGAAILWPFSLQRFFAPWRPIPVSPLGADIFSPYGFSVMKTELLLFLPFFVYAWWPRTQTK
jgi:inner membrane protein